MDVRIGAGDDLEGFPDLLRIPSDLFGDIARRVGMETRGRDTRTGNPAGGPTLLLSFDYPPYSRPSAPFSLCQNERQQDEHHDAHPENLVRNPAPRPV